MRRYDPTAWRLFETLMLLVDKESGVWQGGRHQLSSADGYLKDSAIYKALLRLKKAKMVTLSSNSRFTTIRICNWSDYQVVGNSSGNNKVTTKYQQSNTLTRIENKELRNNNIYVETQKVYDLFIEKFDRNPNLYKLTTARKAKIKTRLEDTGYDLIAQAITNISRQPFYLGDNDRGWKADLEFILRSYEQVERLATQQTRVKKGIDIL
jgi:hypothetical protein